MKVEGSFVIVAYLCVEICIFLCFGGHLGRHLGKWYWQTILTTINGFLDLGTMKLEGSFVIVAYLWAEICIFPCFGGHLSRHLGKWYWQTILATKNGFLDLGTMKLESSFVIVPYLWAEICIFLCFGGHLGRHLGKWYWQIILTTINGFLDPGTMKLESSFVIVAIEREFVT